MPDISVSKSTAATPGTTVVPLDGDDWVGGGKRGGSSLGGLVNLTRKGNPG